jgi:hypothetical protein
MNHITRLQIDLAAAQATLAAKDQAIQAFRAHLDGEKFRGFEDDGSRKDWIAIADILAWLAMIKSAEA